MKTIASFTIDHLKLLPGVYVSRKDHCNNQIITTFDIRLTRPNFEPVMQTGEIHTIEHLAATFLRNHATYGSDVLYFGPMGCRTGFYLLLAKDLSAKELIPCMISLFEWIRDFEGAIPGASALQCGNYTDMDLPGAKQRAKQFLEQVLYSITPQHYTYPV